MTTVYLDRSAILLGWGDPEPVPVPRLREAVEALRMTGHTVVVAGIDPRSIGLSGLRWLTGLSWLPGPPPPEDPPAWFLTGERQRCGERRRGLRTVLVGGGPSPASGRGRCDEETPDLRSAVLAVIAREVMSEG
jgi:hypothetical protein